VLLILFTNAICLLFLQLPISTPNSDQAETAQIELIGKSTVDKKALNFAEGPAAKFSTTVNGRTHQQSPVVSHRGFQYATYYDTNRRVCIARRKLPSGKWDVIRFNDHQIKTNDSHNTAVIGICKKDGTIHMAFDHHATQLNYRISKRGAANKPESVRWNTKLFSPVIHSLGSVDAASRVTYPRFFSTPSGNLMLFYRGKTSGDGDGILEEYDGKRHDWTPGLGKVIARDLGTFEANGKKSQFRCAYMNSISYAGKRLHASWVWRDRFEKTNPRNQHDLCYAYSDDDGRTWRNSAGKVVGKIGKKFIHLNTPGLVVAKIPTNMLVTNQNTHYAYPDNSVHVVLRHKPKGNRGSCYHHYWRSKLGVWNHNELPFTGKRPKVVGLKSGSLILAFNNEVRLQLAYGVPNSNGSKWAWSEFRLRQVQSIAGEPLIDLERWEQDQILSIYGQEEPKKNVKTTRPQPLTGTPSPLMVVDYRLSPPNSSAAN
jgi:hypothetical protein